MSGIFDLSGKTALVTGGNGGIGLGIARGLAGAGANIVVAARNQAKTDEAVAEIASLGVGALGVAMDVLDESSVAEGVSAAVSEFGVVEILVNNAGIGIRKPPQDYSLEEWQQVVGINLDGTFLCSREVYPLMKSAGGGKIINIGSMTSVFGSDWVAAYSASKGGVVQLTKSLAVAWAPDNIQVNSILPGWIHTDLTAPIRNQFTERYEYIRSRIPHGRWGEPDEMGGAAVFLASAASDYVTGVSLPVDGGYTSF
ncbi:MAG: glucose 1-dehydrogenase [Dehalococcoidia bacterium]|nr:glucose 1-dehydrogenase [Dehalococcoidia bacterium]